ncbi:hypothetical protein ACIGO6_37610 [Streptomyces sp. NPDC053750]|uniref:hypothetical protein n=1 Tax=Streptomyces sp. NPDC053750 TaxID=3365714 RepID=UPI0037CDEAC8
MDPHGPTAQRFPLVARFRPPCPPLAERVHSLVELAGTAVEKSDQVLASAACNQAALVASDVGLPDLARELCRRHAAAYLHACPLPGTSAIRGLEPVVNLARLQIRAGRADEGRQRLLDLYAAVEAGAAAQFEDIAVPSDLTATDEDRDEVRAWLWRVLLADGTRTLTSTGRWAEAEAHIEAHRGVGKRMLDGRQVAVVAALTVGATARATALLADTIPGDPWEQAVTSCLTVLCRRSAGQPVDHHMTNLVKTYIDRKPEPGTTIFDVRLGLTVLDATGSTQTPAAHRIVDDLHRRTTQAQDGYAARETLAHPLFTAIASGRQAQDCRDLVHACALGAGGMPNELQGELASVVRTGNSVIRASLAPELGLGRTPPMERA